MPPSTDPPAFGSDPSLDGGLSSPGELLELLAQVDDEEIIDIVTALPKEVIAGLLDITASDDRYQIPSSPGQQALELDRIYRTRVHLDYLSRRLAVATRDVENGSTRFLVVSMPPRTGKSMLASTYLPLWLLRKHPDWRIGLISHTPTLAVGWGRQVRQMIEEYGPRLGISLARDAGAASEWRTTARGGVVSRSAPGQSITGLGFKVMLCDDIVKDFAAAHSSLNREAVWNWWLANASTRLEPPSLVVVIGTRWHEDDFIGRLLSKEYEGDPTEWEEIKFPAIAETRDVLGRAEGEPLISPLMEETPDEALDRWNTVRRSVGSYAWAALYQQRPAPAKGAIFDSDWWRFWTINPAYDDGEHVRYFDPSQATSGKWLDSWDCAFKAATDSSSYVVGQRWCRLGANRYLVAQQRGRWTFTQTIARMEQWHATSDDYLSPQGHLVHERLIEEKANGAAVIDVLKERVSGLKPVNPNTSKEARARIVTPEIESGHVYLPYLGDPGNEWVADLLSELRNFPHDAYDDQVDTLTQALSGLRDPGKGQVSVPSRVAPDRRIVHDYSRASTPRRLPTR